MDGFTGLDVDRARLDIQSFVIECNNWITNFLNVTSDLANTLNAKWASPVAYDFSMKYTAEISKLDIEFTTEYCHIESGAVDAARTLASANGASFAYDSATSEGLIGTGERRYHPFNGFNCRESINGVVGMDTEGVRIALETFKSKVIVASNELDHIPDSIAFYDPNGQMIESYNRNIESIRGQFRYVIYCIEKDLSNALETEYDNILLAKEQATQSMNA